MNGPTLLALDGAMTVMPVEVEPFDGVPDFWGQPGWARFARKVLLTETNEAMASDTGPLLSAEWIDTNGRSCRVMARADSPGQREKIIFPVANDGWECERVAVWGRGGLAERTLIYDIYWTDDGEGAVRPAIDVFRGFGPMKGSEP